MARDPRSFQAALTLSHCEQMPDMGTLNKLVCVCHYHSLAARLSVLSVASRVHTTLSTVDARSLLNLVQYLVELTEL